MQKKKKKNRERRHLLRTQIFAHWFTSHLQFSLSLRSQAIYLSEIKKIRTKLRKKAAIKTNRTDNKQILYIVGLLLLYDPFAILSFLRQITNDSESTAVMRTFNVSYSIIDYYRFINVLPLI